MTEDLIAELVNEVLDVQHGEMSGQTHLEQEAAQQAGGEEGEPHAERTIE